MNFGNAIAHLRHGGRVARSGWNGKGMFLYLVPAASYPAQTDIAKAEFGEMVPYREYIAVKNPQGDVSTWAPSIGDCLAEDWYQVETAQAEAPEADAVIVNLTEPGEAEGEHGQG